MSVPEGEITAQGLAMPHSPRWHEGNCGCWNQGTGSLGTVDSASGRFGPAARVPGFARGLGFAAPSLLWGCRKFETM